MVKAVAKKQLKKQPKISLFGLVLPGLLILAWIMALSGSAAPGAIATDTTAEGYIRWMLYFGGWVFVVSSLMHSLFSKKTSASIDWKSNGFEYELAAASLGLGVACFYAGQHGLQAWVTAAIPVIFFLVLAGLNHVKEIIKDRNYAPNNTLILIWDFGYPLSLAVLLWPLVK